MTRRASGASGAEVLADMPDAVRLFVDGLRTGGWDGMAECLAPDVVYDASVPGWRYQLQGAARVMEEYRDEWTGQHTWAVIELHVAPTADGAVVDFELRGPCPGDDQHAGHEEAVRVANIFVIDDGRIAEHRFYCCGQWDQETIRRIEAEAPKLEGEERST